MIRGSRSSSSLAALLPIARYLLSSIPNAKPMGSSKVEAHDPTVPPRRVNDLT